MQTDALLDCVHKNARTGLYTLPKIKEQSSDRHFKEELSIEEASYRMLYHTAESYNGGPSAHIGTLAKLRSTAMIRLSGDNTSKLAQMLILGSTMGIVDVTRALSQNPNAPRTHTELAREFLSVEERNVAILKQYL